MEYAIAFQFFCGAFAAFVAGRKGRSRALWWLIGGLLPVAGVVLSLTVAAAPPERARRGGPAGAGKRAPVRPKRCCGSYIADCRGCPYYRRVLFDADAAQDLRGYCEFYSRDLAEEPRQVPKLTIEDD